MAKHIFSLGLGAAVLTGGLALPLPATALDEGCVTQACHGNILKAPQVHSAVEDAGCTFCHQPGGKPKNCKSGQGFATEPDPDLCYECHDEPDPQTRHAALLRGCLSCHRPHGGPFRDNLVDYPVSKICFNCHEEFASGASVHKPVGEGGCNSCHVPHSSGNKPLLKKDKKHLCSMCHQTPDNSDPASHTWTHAPAKEGECLGCHEPHTSKNIRLLRKPVKELCLGCHGVQAKGPLTSIKKIKLDAKHVHTALQKGLCNECHDPHGSANESLLLTANTKDLCFGCHDAFKQKYKHSAVILGRCAKCHNPHASNNPKLLNATGSDLCFICHADDVSGRASVHKPVVESGCQTCHRPHDAGNHKLLVQPDVNSLCLSCHGPKGPVDLKIDLDLPVVHKVIKRFGCKGCHDPHGSNEPRLLIAKINTLCATCHPQQKDGLHIISGLSGKPHPVGGEVADPSRPGRTMVCTSCHNPHASKAPKLFQGGLAGTALCGRCHTRFAVKKHPDQDVADDADKKDVSSAGAPAIP